MYSAIEPEMSQSATIGGGRRTRASKFKVDDALQRTAETAARIDAAAAPVRREAARRAAVVGHDELGDQRAGARDFGGGHLREVARLQDFGGGHRQSRVEIERGRGLLVFARAFLNNASATRVAPACAFCGGLSGRACGDIIAMSFSRKPLRFQKMSKT